MIDILASLMPIAGILGLGGAGTIACIALGFFSPRHMFMAAIAAAAFAAATFMYAKGTHDDYLLQLARTREAMQNEFDKEDKARDEAEKYVQTTPLPVPAPGNNRDHALDPAAAGGVRDKFNRDQYEAGLAPVKRRGVPPVAPDHVLSNKGHVPDGPASPVAQPDRKEPSLLEMKRQ